MIVAVIRLATGRGGRCCARAAGDHVVAGLRKRHLDDLQRDMGDLKPVVQQLGSIFQESIVRMTMWHDQMRGQRNVRGSRSPNIEVVYPTHSGQGCQAGMHRLRVDTVRHTVK